MAQTFLPYHFPAIFDRTYAAARNSQGVVCALLCATSLEAFVHDFMGWYNFVKTHPMSYGENSYPVHNYLKEDEISILDKVIAAEREKESVTNKFHCFTDWNKSEKTYQDFKMLINIRNSIAHLKAEELTHDGDFINGYPKFLNDFFQKRIIEQPKDFLSWIELIETQEFCLWCQNAAHTMITKTVNILPETNTKKHFRSIIDDVFFDINTFRKRYKNAV